MSVSMYPHQVEMVARFSDRLRRGAPCLCTWGVGGGKTLAGLSAALAAAGEGARVVVACPRATGAHWQATCVSVLGLAAGQVRLWGSGDGGGARVQITTHESLPKVDPAGVAVVILDEAHVYRTADSVLFRRTREFLRQARGAGVLALTATPVYNDLLDAQNLIALICRSAPSPFVAPADLHSGMIHREAVLPALPEVTVVDELVSLTKEEVGAQRSLLQEARSSWPFKMGRLASHAQHDALREASVVTLREFPESSKEVRMVDIIKSHVREYDGDGIPKVVVAARSICVLKHAAAVCKLHLEWARCFLLTGDTCTTDHGSILQRFATNSVGLASKVDVLFISTDANSEGIDLTVATNMILMDSASHFSPQHEEQVVGRVRRPGLARPVRVHRLVARGTCDEIIPRAFHADKRRRAASFLERGAVERGAEIDEVPASHYLEHLERTYAAPGAFRSAPAPADGKRKRYEAMDTSAMVCTKMPRGVKNAKAKLMAKLKMRQPKYARPPA